MVCGLTPNDNSAWDPTSTPQEADTDRSRFATTRFGSRMKRVEPTSTAVGSTPAMIIIPHHDVVGQGRLRHFRWRERPLANSRSATSARDSRDNVCQAEVRRRAHTVNPSLHRRNVIFTALIPRDAVWVENVRIGWPDQSKSEAPER